MLSATRPAVCCLHQLLLRGHLLSAVIHLLFAICHQACFLLSATCCLLSVARPAVAVCISYYCWSTCCLLVATCCFLSAARPAVCCLPLDVCYLPPAALPFGDILANLVATFAAFGHHSLLWPKATTFEWSQRPYLQLLAAIVRYGQRPPVPSVVNTSIITQPGSSILLSCIVVVGVATAQGNQRASRNSILLLFNGSYNFN